MPMLAARCQMQVIEAEPCWRMEVNAMVRAVVNVFSVTLNVTTRTHDFLGCR